MKTTNNLINKVSQLAQSKWILPTLMALTLVTAFLGLTGCSSPQTFPPHH